MQVSPPQLGLRSDEQCERLSLRPGDKCLSSQSQNVDSDLMGGAVTADLFFVLVEKAPYS